MIQLNREQFLAALVEAYNLGVYACKETNFRKWTLPKAAKEQANINRLLKNAGEAKLTDEEYDKFCT